MLSSKRNVALSATTIAKNAKKPKSKKNRRHLYQGDLIRRIGIRQLSIGKDRQYVCGFAENKELFRANNINIKKIFFKCKKSCPGGTALHLCKIFLSANPQIRKWT
jgi:uncharacterized FlgJ-related protein